MMKYATPGTARLRAVSADERKRILLAAYRRTRTFEAAAYELGIPQRTMCRMVKESGLNKEFEKLRDGWQKKPDSA